MVVVAVAAAAAATTVVIGGVGGESVRVKKVSAAPEQGNKTRQQHTQVTAVDTHEKKTHREKKAHSLRLVWHHLCPITA